MSPRILVAGATGAVGGELIRHLRARGADVTGVSSRGAPGQHAWRIGSEPPPRELRDTSWDVIVNSAADTRWNLPADQAEAANVGPTNALLDLADEHTHFLQLSTTFAAGLRGDGASTDPADYRNTYEWSKAWAERTASARHARTDVVRFPMVMGRRTDGAIDRFSGLFWIVSGLCSGVIPAVVGVKDAYVEIVAADDLAAWITDTVYAGPPEEPRTSVLGRGADAPRVGEMFDLTVEGLNSWRVPRGASALSTPPFVTPEAWNRFHLPFARETLSRVQLRRVEMYAAYQVYLAIEDPIGCTHVMPDPADSIRSSQVYWAENNARAASAEPKAWTG
ncbi:SDR family oxidoreductase [Streptomyces griseoloalbus]|uniref:NAD-dependent epimerase/dehydratase family protein n=1 Tax=Streptomyces griseoloalbus TaxID=67303 RepID=UPI0033B2910D